MSTVSEIIDRVKGFGAKEKEEFLARLCEVNFGDVWDRQLMSDAKIGQLDCYLQQTLKDIQAGRIRALDEVSDDVP